jgi:hypothetical protein
MANFTDITCSGQLTAFQVSGGIAAQGLGLTPSEGSTIALSAGANNNLVLPELGAPGPGSWAVSAGSSGESITGFQTTNGQTLLPGQVITIVNVGANPIDITANAGGSAVGNKIAAAAQIPAGCAMQFIYVGVAGAGLWYPFYGIANS